MSGATNFRWAHKTASAVIAGQGAAGSQGSDNVSGKQAILHTVTINSAAATASITVYDYNSTSAPPAAQAIGGAIVAPAGGITVPVTLIYDVEVDIGITIIIATAAADVTVAYR